MRVVSTASGDAELVAGLDWCDVLVVQGWSLAATGVRVPDRVCLVADLYDPMHLEQLEQGYEAGSPEGRAVAVTDTAAVLNQQMLRGDFFLCASERQRHFWLGHLAALGRVNPMTYDADPTLRALLAVVPFGIPSAPPPPGDPAIRGVLPGVDAADPVILWGGGVYNWLDPLTLVRAVAALRSRVPDVRLVFMGLRHPNPEVPEMRMAAATRALADSLGLTGSTVIFNEGWVPYEERHRFLMDADVAVSTHLHHVETEFSYRTRVLDYLWAGVPVVCTGGDAVSDLVARESLGLVVPPGDVDALEGALHRLLTDAEFADGCRRNIAGVRPSLTWSAAAAPLVDWCASPQRAPDRDRPPGPPLTVTPRTGWRRDLPRLRRLLARRRPPPRRTAHPIAPPPPLNLSRFTVLVAFHRRWSGVARQVRRSATA